MVGVGTHCRQVACSGIVQGRNLDDFDHVKRDLRLEDEAAAAAAAADPMNALNQQGLSEDMKRVMAKLGTADAGKARAHPTWRNRCSPSWLEHATNCNSYVDWCTRAAQSPTQQQKSSIGALWAASLGKRQRGGLTPCLRCCI